MQAFSKLGLIKLNLLMGYDVLDKIELKSDEFETLIESKNID